MSRWFVATIDVRASMRASIGTTSALDMSQANPDDAAYVE
jgi:hypothetical protein